MQAPHFNELLLHWHRHHNKRTMPWKGETDTYKIWLSEISLQQTRVEQGLAYYEKFIQQHPTVTQLAEAPAEAVFK
jgi:A/G-specific adenine glycosylase